MIKYLVKMILKQMIYTSVCTLWDQSGATTGLVQCMWEIIIHENVFFYIFNEKFVKILWKQDCDVRCAKFFSK